MNLEDAKMICALADALGERMDNLERNAERMAKELEVLRVGLKSAIYLRAPDTPPPGAPVRPRISRPGVAGNSMEN
ncbi:hypothetical protein [Cupriavidus sp. AcVe19-6a]|uniref:hypothetical protein n=1 Tax=Cupriavidus sp. AcVe19-6a TaxID=2821358 RepID=UPI001AE81EAD|nr:hypothetical protein [Cupriavidus sp. AcVe19-6a]MBP0635533.1 hypothetical protein [Cupriavidus sp. AcVe19-6a]